MESKFKTRVIYLEDETLDNVIRKAKGNFRMTP